MPFKVFVVSWLDTVVTTSESMLDGVTTVRVRRGTAREPCPPSVRKRDGEEFDVEIQQESTDRCYNRCVVLPTDFYDEATRLIHDLRDSSSTLAHLCWIFF